MRSVKFIALVLLGVSGIYRSVSAQTRTLSLRDALNYALANNINVKKAKLAAERGRYKTQEVRAQALPQLTGSAGLTYNPIVGQLVVGDQSFQMGRPWNSQVGVQFSQQLFNQQVFTGLQAAKASESYYELNTDLTEEQIIEQVSGLYYQILLNKQQLTVIDTNIRNTQRMERIINDQYKNGLARKIDLDRTRVGLSNYQTSFEQLKNTITTQQNQLKFVIGMPVSESVSLPEEQLSGINLNPDLGDTVKYQGRISYQVLKQQEILYKLQEKAYKSEYYPTLALNSSYSYTGMSDRFDLYKSGGTAFWYEAMDIGVALRIPVFNGFATRSRVRQAKVDVLENQADQQNLIQSLNMENENAKLQIRNSINTIKSQEANVRLANDVYTSTQNNYKNGLATLTDLLDAESSLTDAKNNYNQALLNYKISEIQLLKAKGSIKSLTN